MVDQYQKPMADYYVGLTKLLPHGAAQRINAHADELTTNGIEESISQRLSQLEFLYHGLDVARVASEC